MTDSISHVSNYLVIVWVPIAALGCFICIVLLIYHLSQAITTDTANKTANINKKQNLFFYRTMSILTLLSMTGFTISIIIATINHFLCFFRFDQLTPVFYQLAKCCIYLGFSNRLYHVYRGNAIILTIYTILIIISYITLSMYGYISISHNKYEFNNIIICKKTFSNLFLITSMFTDVINTVFSLIYHYISPLVSEMNSLISDWKVSYNGRDLKYHVIKLSILTSVATITTILAHIISIISQTYVAFLLDIPVNMLCVMLMAPYYSSLYETMCCGTIECVGIFDTDNKSNKLKVAHKTHDNTQCRSNQDKGIESNNVESIKMDTTKIEDTQMSIEDIKSVAHINKQQDLKESEYEHTLGTAPEQTTITTYLSKESQTNASKLSDTVTVKSPEYDHMGSETQARIAKIKNNDTNEDMDTETKHCCLLFI
eukprot:76876_1